MLIVIVIVIVIVIAIVVTMPTMIDNHHLFLCVSSAPVTIAVMIAIVVAITLYDNRVLGLSLIHI